MKASSPTLSSRPPCFCHAPASIITSFGPAVDYRFSVVLPTNRSFNTAKPWLGVFSHRKALDTLMNGLLATAGRGCFFRGGWQRHDDFRGQENSGGDSNAPARLSLGDRWQLVKTGSLLWARGLMRRRWPCRTALTEVSCRCRCRRLCAYFCRPRL
jgi:hypothetical protein